MISPETARERAKEHLAGLPPAVSESYIAFAETREPRRVDEVVLGVLQFYLAKGPATPLSEMPRTTRLVEDLGCDSLTMVDILFLAESLFDVRLSDEEMGKVSTLGDLLERFRKQVLG